MDPTSEADAEEQSTLPILTIFTEKLGFAKKVADVWNEDKASNIKKDKLLPYYEFIGTWRGSEWLIRITWLNEDIFGVTLDKCEMSSLERAELVFDAKVNWNVKGKLKANLQPKLLRLARASNTIIYFTDNDAWGELLSFNLDDLFERNNIHKNTLRLRVNNELIVTIRDALFNLSFPFNKDACLGLRGERAIEYKSTCMLNDLMQTGIKGRPFTTVPGFDEFHYAPSAMAVLTSLVDYEEGDLVSTSSFQVCGEVCVPGHPLPAIFASELERPEAEAEKVAAKLSADRAALDIDEVIPSVTKFSKPLPLDTSSLVSLADQATGGRLSVGQINALTESLHVKKAITYPRSESKEYAPGLVPKVDLAGLAKHPRLGSRAQKILANLPKASRNVIRTRAEDVSELAHEAIRIVSCAADVLESLEEGDETILFDAICAYVLSTLADDAVVNMTTVIASAGGEKFSATAKRLEDSDTSFMTVFPMLSKEEFETSLPPFKAGEQYEVKRFFIKPTKDPAPPMTTLQLLILLEKAGIGTPGSRPQLIDKICKLGYAVIGPDGIIRSTEKGRAIIAALRAVDDDLVSVDYRRSLSQQFRLMTQGKEAFDAASSTVISHYCRMAELFREKTEAFCEVLAFHAAAFHERISARQNQRVSADQASTSAPTIITARELAHAQAASSDHTASAADTEQREWAQRLRNLRRLSDDESGGADADDPPEETSSQEFDVVPLGSLAKCPGESCDGHLLSNGIGGVFLVCSNDNCMIQGSFRAEVVRVGKRSMSDPAFHCCSYAVCLCALQGFDGKRSRDFGCLRHQPEFRQRVGFTTSDTSTSAISNAATSARNADATISSRSNVTASRSSLSIAGKRRLSSDMKSAIAQAPDYEDAFWRSGKFIISQKQVSAPLCRCEDPKTKSLRPKRLTVTKTESSSDQGRLFFQCPLKKATPGDECPGAFQWLASSDGKPVFITQLQLPERQIALQQRSAVPLQPANGVQRKRSSARIESGSARNALRFSASSESSSLDDPFHLFTTEEDFAEPQLPPAKRKTLSGSGSQVSGPAAALQPELTDDSPIDSLLAPPSVNDIITAALCVAAVPSPSVMLRSGLEERSKSASPMKQPQTGAVGRHSSSSLAHRSSSSLALLHDVTMVSAPAAPIRHGCPEDCAFTTLNVNDLLEHWKLKHQCTEGVYHCPRCALFFNRKDSAKRHYEVKHAGVRDQVTPCINCGVLLSTAYNCRRHEATCFK